MCPLLVNSLTCSYGEFLTTMETIDFDKEGSGCFLPTELAIRVAHYLTILPVHHEDVEVTDCSSHDHSHPLESCLDSDEDSWWMAASGSMTNDIEKPWIHFSLTDKPACRLTSVSFKIPPLPHGPLSLREFSLDISLLKRNEPESILRNFALNNQSGWQRFELQPPLDAYSLKLRCLSNQISGFISDEGTSREALYATVGFYTIRFD